MSPSHPTNEQVGGGGLGTGQGVQPGVACHCVLPWLGLHVGSSGVRGGLGPLMRAVTSGYWEESDSRPGVGPPWSASLSHLIGWSILVSTDAVSSTATVVTSGTAGRAWPAAARAPASCGVCSA